MKPDVGTGSLRGGIASVKQGGSGEGDTEGGYTSAMNSLYRRMHEHIKHRELGTQLARNPKGKRGRQTLSEKARSLDPGSVGANSQEAILRL